MKGARATTPAPAPAARTWTWTWTTGPEPAAHTHPTNLGTIGTWVRIHVGMYRSDFQITQTYTRLQPARPPAYQPACQAYLGNPAPTHKATTRTRYNNTTRQDVNQGIWQLGSAGHKMPTPGRLRKPWADLWAAAREGKKVVVVAAVEVTCAGLRVKYSVHIHFVFMCPRAACEGEVQYTRYTPSQPFAVLPPMASQSVLCS